MFSFVWRQYPEDLTDPYFIRETVFMDEQGFSEEFDETDKRALHLTLYLDGARAGCARLYEEEGGWHIGRVAVLKPFRGMGLGAELLREAERRAASLGAEAVRLSAQVQAQGFYEKLGYRAVTGPYLDEHCPHVGMEKKLGG
ncbi:MAG TPA: GNAT family N-acetyltransferase [Candidatus Merdivicinus faecavium]|nr:GNAT family N-acetyltransferase [Candidatus Merdivicinus faecavium]